MPITARRKANGSLEPVDSSPIPIMPTKVSNYRIPPVEKAKLKEMANKQTGGNETQVILKLINKEYENYE